MKKTPTLNDINELSKQGRCHSSATYYAVFGSYVEAVRRARLKQHYLQQFDETDRARLLQELRALSKRLKRPLVGKDVREAAAPTIPSDRKGALKDLPPRPSATPPIQGGELDRHASLVKRGAKRLPSGNYKDRLVSPINHFWAVFGTIPKAIAAAGVGPKLTYSNEELIAHLRKVATGLDRPVQVSDLEKLYREGKGPAPETIEHRFGGLAKARKAAGVLNTYNKAGKRTNYWQKYTPEELIGQLKALGKKLGKKPTLKDVNRASKEGMCASHTTLKGMFGSIPQAFRAAGFHEIEKNARKHTDREIIFAIKKLKKELGRFPGYHDFLAGSKAGKCPSPGTIVRRIGKLTEIRDRF